MQSACKIDVVFGLSLSYYLDAALRERAMKKAILAISFAMFSLFSWPVRADVITYQCDEEGETNIIQVDTETNSALLSLGGETDQGSAQIGTSSIVVTTTARRAWSIKIDRATGEFSDSDGTTGSCVLS
jgi:hypothetical protein